jgi:hypothetical protein
VVRVLVILVPHLDTQLYTLLEVEVVLSPKLETLAHWVLLAVEEVAIQLQAVEVHAQHCLQA